MDAGTPSILIYCGSVTGKSDRFPSSSSCGWVGTCDRWPSPPLSLPLHMQSASRDRVRSSRKVCPSQWAQLCPASPKELLENRSFSLGVESGGVRSLFLGREQPDKCHRKKSPFYAAFLDAVVFPLDRDDGGGIEARPPPVRTRLLSH